VAEVGPGVYRVATYHERLRSSVNQFVIAGDEPALISTGLRESFAQTWAGIAEILDPATLRSIVIPHFEADECGALNDFLERAPRATALGSMRAVIASLADFALRPPRGLGDGEVVSTGGGRALRVFEMPYVHAWDGIVLADEQAQVVFTSDLFIQPGLSEPVSRDDRSALSAQHYRTFYGVPPEPYLQRALERIESLAPALLAPGHGSALTGNLAPYYRAYRGLTAAARSLPGALEAELGAR
jgi:flavorubredoxin